MFDVDDFVADCRQALTETEPRLAIKEVLERAVANPEQVDKALPVTHRRDRADLRGARPQHPEGRVGPRHEDPRAQPSDVGGDRPVRRAGGQLAVPPPGASIIQSGGRELRTKEVALFGDDTIHAVHNPLSVLTGAIHVYGGDLTTQLGRSEWDEESLAERPMDFDRTRELFEEANARYSTPG